MKPAYTEQHWSQIFALMSLDGARHIFPSLGLDLPEPLSFQLNLRKCIVLVRTQRDNRASSASEETFQCLENALESDLYRYFFRWTKMAYLGSHADQPQISGWEIVLTRWSKPERRPAVLLLPETKLIGNLLSDLKSENQTLWNETIAALKLQPLSEWDVDIYNRRNWNHFDDIKDPYGALLLAASAWRSLQILRLANDRLSATDLLSLRDAGQALLETLGVWMPESLIDIPTLVAGL